MQAFRIQPAASHTVTTIVGVDANEPFPSSARVALPGDLSEHLSPLAWQALRFCRELTMCPPQPKRIPRSTIRGLTSRNATALTTRCRLMRITASPMASVRGVYIWSTTLDDGVLRSDDRAASQLAGERSGLWNPLAGHRRGLEHSRPSAWCAATPEPARRRAKHCGYCGRPRNPRAQQLHLNGGQRNYTPARHPLSIALISGISDFDRRSLFFQVDLVKSQYGGPSQLGVS